MPFCSHLLRCVLFLSTDSAIEVSVHVPGQNQSQSPFPQVRLCLLQETHLSQHRCLDQSQFHPVYMITLLIVHVYCRYVTHISQSSQRKRISTAYPKVCFLWDRFEVVFRVSERLGDGGRMGGRSACIDVWTISWIVASVPKVTYLALEYRIGYGLVRVCYRCPCCMYTR